MSYQFGNPSRFGELSDPSGPVAQAEWQEFLRRREELLDQIMGRIQARSSLIQGEDPNLFSSQVPDPDEVDRNINTQALMSQDNRASWGTSEYNDLLGQAEFYGISNPESVAPQELARLIERRRSGVLNERINAGEFEAGVMERGVDALRTGLGTIFTGSTKALIDLSQRIPFIGDVLARTETIREADQWINKVAEGYRGGLTEDEETGWRIANGAAGMLGYALPAAANYAFVSKALAGVPIVTRLSPIMRGALAGGLDAWMLEGGGDAPLVERGANIAFGAGLGGAGEAGGAIAGAAFGATVGGLGGYAATEDAGGAAIGAGIGAAGGAFAGSALTRIFAKAQRSFPSDVGGSPKQGFNDWWMNRKDGEFGADNQLLSDIRDGEWRFEEDLMLESAPLRIGAGAEPPPPRVRLDDYTPPQTPPPSPEPIGLSSLESGGSELQRALQVSRGEGTRLLGTPQRNELERLRSTMNELIEQRNMARRQAEMHPLTGLANRRAFEAAKATADADPSVGFVVMDARGFKQINDTLGHTRGDEALQNFALALQRTARDLEVPARLFHFGGDEFAAIVPTEKLSEFAAKAQKLSRQRFAAPGEKQILEVLDEENYPGDGDYRRVNFVLPEASPLPGSPRYGGSSYANLMRPDNLSVSGLYYPTTGELKVVVPESVEGPGSLGVGAVRSYGTSIIAEMERRGMPVSSISGDRITGAGAEVAMAPDIFGDYGNGIYTAIPAERFKKLRTELDTFVGSTFDEADRGLMNYKASTRQRGESLSAPKAAVEAIQLSKQTSIMESPALGMGGEFPAVGSVIELPTGSFEVVEQLTWHGKPSVRLREAGVSGEIMPRSEWDPELGLVGMTPNQPRIVSINSLQGQITRHRAAQSIAAKPLLDDGDVIRARQASNPGQVVVMERVDPASLADRADVHIIGEVYRPSTDPQVTSIESAYSDDLAPLIEELRAGVYRKAMAGDPEAIAARTRLETSRARTDRESPFAYITALVGATDEQAAQFRQYGLFVDQKVTTANGKEAIVTGFDDKGNVKLRSPANKGLQYKAKRENVFPSNSGQNVIDAPQEYSAFANEAMGKMASEAIAAGLTPPRWTSAEMSSQLPRYMDEYFKANGIEGDARGLLETYFNYQRVQDFKQLAPDVFAHAEQLQREASELLAMRAESQHDLPVEIEELAAAKGFEYTVSETPTGIGDGTLRDQQSQLQVPVEDEDAARAFLQNFDREMPDITPISTTPAELFDTIPGGSAPTDGPEPAWIDTEHKVEWTEKANDSMERDLRYIGVNSARRLSGGGGGGQIPPTGSYAQLPPPPPGPRPGEQFRRADPRRLAQALQKQDSLWLRYAEPLKNYMLTTQRNLEEAGISTELWRGYHDITTGVNIAHNEAGPYMQEWADITSRFRHKIQRDGTVVKIEQIPNWNDKLRAMEKAGYNAEEIQAQQMIRPFFDKLWGLARESAPIGYIFDYLPALRNLQSRQSTVDPFGQWERNHLPYEWQWFARYPRAHNTQARHMSIADLGTMYVRALFFEKNVAPAWNAMKKDWAHPAIPEDLAVPINGWLDLVMTGVGAQNDVMISGFRHVLNKLGVPASDHDIRSMFGGALGTMYRAGLGLSPHVVFRDAIQPLFTGTEIGFKWVADAYKGWMGSNAARDAMWERALKGGWVQKGQTQVATSDVFSSDLSTATGESVFPDNLAQRRESWARVLDRVYDATPRGARQGMQGRWWDPLLAYTKLGEINRLIAGEAGYQKAMDAFKRQLGESNWSEQKLLSETGMIIYPEPIQRRFLELAQTDIEGAVNLAANQAADSQFRYGTMESPVGIQQLGSTGRAIMMFGTFTTQYIARMRQNLQNLGRSGAQADAAAFLGRQTAIWAAITGASAATGWKALEKWKWHRSLTFAGGPPAVAAFQSVQAGTGVVSTALGDMPSPEQKSAMGQFGMRGLSGFFPYSGGVRTLQGAAMALEGVAPGENLSRGLISGEWGAGRTFKSLFDDPDFIHRFEWGVAPEPTLDINDVLNDRNRAQGLLGGGVVFDTTPKPAAPVVPQSDYPIGGGGALF
jgi:diguanylate cyclase (GGDEF)-like protein